MVTINVNTLSDKELLDTLGTLLEDANINQHELNSYPAHVINNMVYRVLTEVNRRKLKLIRLSVDNTKKKAKK